MNRIIFQLSNILNKPNLSCVTICNNYSTNNKSQDVLPYNQIPKAKGWPVLGTLPDLIRSGGGEQMHKYIASK